jgi:hypothetical protein
MSTEKLKNQPTDTDRASTSEELIETYEPEVNMMSLFMSGDEEQIQNFIKASGLTMERKIGGDGEVETVRLTDDEGKLVWFTDFGWYRKNAEKDLAAEKVRNKVN